MRLLPSQGWPPRRGTGTFARLAAMCEIWVSIEPPSGAPEPDLADPCPLSEYPARAGRSDEVGRTTAALPSWRLAT